MSNHVRSVGATTPAKTPVGERLAGVTLEAAIALLSDKGMSIAYYRNQEYPWVVWDDVGERYGSGLTWDEAVGAALGLDILVLPWVQSIVEDENLNPWKRALIDFHVVNWSLDDETANDPVKSLSVAIQESIKEALDPRISGRPVPGVTTDANPRDQEDN